MHVSVSNGRGGGQGNGRVTSLRQGNRHERATPLYHARTRVPRKDLAWAICPESILERPKSIIFTSASPPQCVRRRFSVGSVRMVRTSTPTTPTRTRMRFLTYRASGPGG